MYLLSFSGAKHVAGWSDGGRRCVSTSRRPPPLLLSFLLAAVPSLLCSLVKDFSFCKFNQTAWIKAITQFVYKASFILSGQRSVDNLWPPTFAEVTWCIYYVVQWESFRLLSGDEGLKMHDENPIIQICVTLWQNAKPHHLISRQSRSCKKCLNNSSWWSWTYLWTWKIPPYPIIIIIIPLLKHLIPFIRLLLL